LEKRYANNLRIALWLGLISILLLLSAFLYRTQERKGIEKEITKAEKNIAVLQQRMLDKLEELAKLNSEDEFRSYILRRDESNNGFSFYISIDGELRYWSDNEPVITAELPAMTNGSIARLPNGDFGVYRKVAGNKRITGLLLLRHNYNYQNKYLANELNPAISQKLQPAAVNSGTALKLSDSQTAFNVVMKPAIELAPATTSWLYLFALITAFISIYLLLKELSGGERWKLTIFVFIVVVVRTLMIYYQIPFGLYELSIFSPQYYASSFYFNSPGDLLINIFLLLIMSFVAYEKSAVVPGHKWLTIVTILFFIVAAASVHNLIRGLVLNSKISFEVSDPLQFNVFSLIAFTVISLLLLSFFFAASALLHSVAGYRVKSSHLWLFLAIGALYSSITVSRLNSKKEQEARKLIAQKLELKQDHMAEYLFEAMENKIIEDDEIAGMVFEEFTTDKLNSLLSSKYFTGYLSRFEISALILDNSFDSLTLNNFLQQANSGKKTYSTRLFFLSDESGRSSYLAILPLKNNSHTLVVTLSSRLLKSQTGFPELFLSNSLTESRSPEDYSFARYTKGKLVYEYGPYIYSLSHKDFVNTQQDFAFADVNDYNHLVYRLNADSSIIISRPKESFTGILTLFSWIFSFSAAVTLLLYLAVSAFGSYTPGQWNLTARIQLSVIILVVLSFLLVGTGTVFYIRKKYENDEKKNISDQVNALWFSLNESRRSAEGGNDSLRLLQLQRLVSNTNIDFNIYDKNGRLTFSSQPKIFDKGIISTLMNPRAFFRIKEKGLTQYIHRENAGKLKYIAAYAPFTDSNGEISSFLNLPYFEKQNELNKEVSVFLSAFLNIYVLLFALAVFITLFISSRITKPLLLIQDKISRVRLGETNEQIAYTGNDEIGQLVREYNRMLEELALSAEKLAQSEREGAWRKMAKQVAHEIKNPLTPMKLSVQHLQRTMKEGKSDPALADRIAAMLIEQIDTLSNIASAFSNFAEMPKADPERVKLSEIILHVTGLFKEASAAEFVINLPDHDVFVLADHDQLVRVFTNLLKNALQSFQDEKSGKVEVTVESQSGSTIVSIRDNGSGIPEDQRDKIFNPNFTTKSSGMGLGLAIVKNIVEQSNGTVWFTSIYGQGAAFFVKLPNA
jgi:two-component system, NtrC family, nitrogen regulation sensor histidine kinase NtrY